MIRVLVADDHRLVREGICKLLDADGQIEVVGQAEDGEQTLALVEKYRPDVLILDFSMPKINGLQVIRKLNQGRDPPRIVMLSMHSSSDVMKQALEAGAAAFVAKGATASMLVQTIKTVANSKGEIGRPKTKK